MYSIQSVKLLTEHHLEFLRLRGDCTCLSESTLVKIPHCWKSRVAAHIFYDLANARQNQESVFFSDALTATRPLGDC